MYREIALDCFRYLGFKNFAEIDLLTIPEYELLMEAERLKQIDMDYRCHMLAWLTFAAKAMKKSGKKKMVPVFREFKKFYDYKKELKRAEPKKGRFSGIGKLLKRG